MKRSAVFANFVWALVAALPLWAGDPVPMTVHADWNAPLDFWPGPAIFTSATEDAERLSTTSVLTPDRTSTGEITIWHVLDEAATNTKTFGPKFSRLEYDFDSRGWNVLHFMGGAELPFGFNLWGFIDLESPQVGAREDLSRFFLEIDVKRKLTRELGVIGELNDLHGVGNTTGRLGVFYLPQKELLKERQVFLLVKAFPFSSDGRGSQLSVGWNKNFPSILDGRLSAGGFVDLNFSARVGSDQTVVVQEQQLRFRAFDGVHLIVELRQNGFLQDSFGVAPGIQYRF